MSTDLTPLSSISQLAVLMARGETSSIELVRFFLNRISSFDKHINAFISINEDMALEAAEKCDGERAKGLVRSPLHGIPIAVKDLFDVENTVTTAGGRVYQNHVSQKDAFAVALLKKAGAVILGKLNMNEFAFGITGKNPHFGDVKNPVDPSRLTGGSSSGSAAAVKAGLVPLALGTDTGGSIRIPSAMCGITGLKPSYGLVDKFGVVPLSWSLDHVGPMAKTAADLLPAMEVLADKAFKQRYHIEEKTEDFFKGKKVGILTPFMERCGNDVKTAVQKSANDFESLGAEVGEITLKNIGEAETAAFVILFSEAAASIEPHIINNSESISADVLDNVKLGMTIPAFKYVHAQRVRRRFINQTALDFEKMDFILAPAAPVAAPFADADEIEISKGDVSDVRSAMTRFTRLFNFSGNPSLTMPVTTNADGLPVNIQLVGKHFGDDVLLKAGAFYQEAYPFSSMVPDEFLT